MIMPQPLSHIFLSFILFNVTFSMRPAVNEMEMHQTYPRVIVISEEMYREYLLEAIRDEIDASLGLDAEIIQELRALPPADAIQELEYAEEDALINFYRRVKMRISRIIEAVS